MLKRYKNYFKSYLGIVTGLLLYKRSNLFLQGANYKLNGSIVYFPNFALLTTIIWVHEMPQFVGKP